MFIGRKPFRRNRTGYGDKHQQKRNMNIILDQRTKGYYDEYEEGEEIKEEGEKKIKTDKALRR